MAERKWTLVIVPPGSGASKAVEVSQALLKIAAGFGVVLVLSALLLGYATVSRSVSLQRSSALQRENADLAEQIGQLNGKVDVLSDTLRLIAQRDARIRLMANLEPNDPQVQQAGIGGPAPEGAIARPINVLARRAEEVRVDLAGLIRRANLLAFSFKEATDSISAHRDRLVAMPSIMPTTGWLTSAFASMREHPILHYARPHEGIDVQAPSAPPSSPRRGRSDFHRLGNRLWEHGRDRSRLWDHHQVRPLLEDSGAPGPAGEAGRPDRPGGEYRPRHRPAPPLRGPRAWPAGRSAAVCAAAGGGGLTTSHKLLKP